MPSSEYPEQRGNVLILRLDQSGVLSESDIEKSFTWLKERLDQKVNGLKVAVVVDQFDMTKMEGKFEDFLSQIETLQKADVVFFGGGVSNPVVAFIARGIATLARVKLKTAASRSALNVLVNEYAAA